MEKLKHCHFPKEVVFLCIQWYLRYNLSFSNLTEVMSERGIKVNQSTIRSWVKKFSKELSNLPDQKYSYYTPYWSMDEAHVKIKGKKCYYYRAIGSHGYTIDFYVSSRKNKKVAETFLRKLMLLRVLYKNEE